MLRRIGSCLAVLFFTAAAAVAGPADVESVEVTVTTGGTYRFRVTVRHSDEGWAHYADRWEVRTPDGTLLATRTLLHPHVNEQPFTRELTGVTIPSTNISSLGTPASLAA